MIGTKDEVFYSGSATKDEAQALGNGLKAIGFFTDKGANVFVDKGKDGTIVSFVVKDGVWDNPAMVASFEAIARREASTVGGLPITMHLVNASLDVKKSEPINWARTHRARLTSSQFPPAPRAGFSRVLLQSCCSPPAHTARRQTASAAPPQRHSL